MIFCPECGTPNDDLAKFCKNCGKNLTAFSEGQKKRRTETFPQKPQGKTIENDFGDRKQRGAVRDKSREQTTQKVNVDRVYAEQYKKRRGKSSKSLIIAALAEIVCLALLIGTFYIIADRKSDPEKVAERYFNALTKKDWDTAYDMTDIPEGKFLGRAAYRSVMEKTYDLDNDGCKIKLKSRGRDGKIEVTVDHIGQRDTCDSFKFTLLEQDGKTMLFFPSWKVSSEDQIYKSFKICNIPKGTRLACDGIALTEEDMIPADIEKHEDIKQGEGSCVDSYEVDIFKGIHQIETVVPWCRKDVRACSADEDFGEAEPIHIVLTEKGEQAIKTRMQNGFEKIVTAILNGKDFSEVSDLFAKDYTDHCREIYQEAYDDANGHSSSVINQMTIGEFQFDVGYDDDYHMFCCQMSFRYNKKGTHRGKPYEDSGHGSLTACFVYENGDYKISGFTI